MYSATFAYNGVTKPGLVLNSTKCDTDMNHDKRVYRFYPVHFKRPNPVAHACACYMSRHQAHRLHQKYPIRCL